MEEIDVNELRRQEALLHDLKEIDSINTFYYDETNNIRKFYLNEEGLNANEGLNFVLGGVMHEGKKSDYNLQYLFDGLKLQKNIKELKLHHIAKGNLKECLGSKKLNLFLRWLYNSNLYIHFTNVNVVYFSIVDIIDSIVLGSTIKDFADFNLVNLLKSDLYRLLTLEREDFIRLLFLYQYPNIKKDKVESFIDDIINLIERHDHIPGLHIGLTSIKQLLKEAKRRNELLFLTNEKDYVMIDDFSTFYLRSIYLFKNSMHYFDKEYIIENILDDLKFTDGDMEIKPYEFIESKENQFIQVSDVFIGLLGKLFTFLNDANIKQILLFKSRLSSLEQENLIIIDKLIDKAGDKNKALLLNVTSEDEKVKYAYLFNGDH